MPEPVEPIWVLTQDSDAEGGATLMGVFTSRQEALDFLCDDVLGPARFAELVWEPSPHNPTLSEGRGPGARPRRYILRTAVVQFSIRLSLGREESEHGR